MSALYGLQKQRLKYVWVAWCTYNNYVSFDYREKKKTVFLWSFNRNHTGLKKTSITAEHQQAYIWLLCMLKWMCQRPIHILIELSCMHLFTETHIFSDCYICSGQEYCQISDVVSSSIQHSWVLVNWAAFTHLYDLWQFCNSSFVILFRQL